MFERAPLNPLERAEENEAENEVNNVVKFGSKETPAEKRADADVETAERMLDEIDLEKLDKAA